jgi:hypothetical protein
MALRWNEADEKRETQSLSEQAWRAIEEARAIIEQFYDTIAEIRRAPQRRAPQADGSDN